LGALTVLTKTELFPIIENIFWAISGVIVFGGKKFIETFIA